MADDDRAPSETIEFGGEYDLKSQKVGISLKLPTSLFRKRWSWFEVPMLSWRLRMKARGDAKSNKPATESTSLEDHEKRIDKLRKEKLQLLVEGMHVLIRRAKDRVTRAKPVTFDEAFLKTKIEARQSEIEQHYDRDLKREKKRWEEAGKKEAKERERLEDFITKYNRDSDPKDKDFSQALALVLVAFLIDGVANATLFAGASEMGLLGGLVIAFALSAVNLAIGFITGMYGVRNFFHVENAWRIAGGIVIALGVGSGLFLNLFVAHFRDVAETSIAAAQSGNAAGVVSVEHIDTSPVFDQMIAHPIALHTLLSYLLLASGLIVFIVGLKEGYDGFGDPFPGYSARYKSWSKAKRRYDGLDERRDDRITRAKRSVIRMLNNTRAWFEKWQTLHEVRRDDVEEAVGKMEEAHRRATAAEQRVNDDAGHLLSVYAKENSKYRLDPRRRERFEKQRRPLTDPPARFLTEPTFDTLIPPIQEVKDAAQKSIDGIDRNLTIIRNLLLWIAQRTTTAASQLETLQAGEKDSATLAA